MERSGLPRIIFYSRTGHSRRVAGVLGKRLNAEPFEVTTRHYSWPVLGWIAAARDGMSQVAPRLNERLEVPEEETVILVGPVWAGGAAAPLNTVIDVLSSGCQRVAVVLTCGGDKEETAPLERLENRLGRPLVAGLVLSNAAQDSPEAGPRLEAFLADVQGGGLAS